MDDIEHGKRKRQILKEFIHLYESFPCLWNIKSREYHDREKRTRAYKVLVKKLQQLQPGADRTSVVKKINCLRSNLRKEKRKTLEYLKVGKVYKPQLWYYNLFYFLNDINRLAGTNQEEQRVRINMKVEHDKTYDPLEWSNDIGEEYQPTENLPNEVTVEEEEPINPTIYEIESLPCTYINQHNENKKIVQEDVEETSRIKYVDRNNQNASYSEKELEDRHDVFGRNVAMKLRHISSISNTQRLMAEKIINDALYMAEMELLTAEHSNVLK